MSGRERRRRGVPRPRRALKRDVAVAITVLPEKLSAELELKPLVPGGR